ncbi:acyl-CoA desaturase [Jannaschia pohangensis]|uniref:Stearoyl-CoA desaturase (Delta-9 desaturase) n=1 Tax=Jannaschia pohangensis TaxID=390807 RepID=A0A1I3HQ32_9RHOB|nr:fatty acid desaturase [Jannaschia pohangensis]SFI37733.1 stearoyl-CoA desaturase (delta-9 desaturase) [Jannaschia pohangensis]
MTDWIATERVHPDARTCAMTGRIVWDAPQSLWTIGHGVGGLAGVVLFPAWDAALVFVVLSGVTICAGHSVGMHRLLIHRAFRVPKPLEYLLVWLGVLVGMAGPMGMIRAHDMRDWHQRQVTCPPHPSHGAAPLRDMWWQMHCRFRLTHPLRFVVEAEVARDPIYRAMEATWRWQQLPLALILFAVGGWGWVLWGVCLRVFVSLTGHWAVGHFAHHGTPTGWRIDGLPVQGRNLPGLGLLTFGENWHGNHHAFPHSARLGVGAGQMDPGWWLVLLLERVGLACDVVRPGDRAAREGLVRV